ncbi:MAG: MFS transporter [Clostridia bacterium]|nr:MFS transporter [Clostridia bacterium]
MSQVSTKDKIVNRFLKADDYSAATLDRGILQKYEKLAVDVYSTRQVSVAELSWMAVQRFSRSLKQGLDNYANMYYTKVLKVDLSYVTVIKALISVYDTLNNPLMGIVYDRTRTRWGKARPYVLTTPLPFFLVTALLYSGALMIPSEQINDPKRILYLFFMLFLQETFSTIFNIPTDNYPTLQSPCPSDRIAVSLVQSYAGAYGGDLISTIYIALMSLNNSGTLPVSQPLMFTIIGFVTAFFGTVGTMGVAMKCPERVLLQPKPAPLTKTMFYVLKNKYAMRNVVAGFFNSAWSNGGYSWDVITQLEIFGGAIRIMPLYIFYHICNVISIAFIKPIRDRFKTFRSAVIVMRLTDAVLNVIWAVGGWITMPQKKWWLSGIFFCIGYGLNGLNNAPATALEGEIGREINDYTEYLTGERPDGTFGLLTDYINKLTQPINTMLALAVIKWTGYDTTLDTTYWAQDSVDVYRKVFALYAVGNLVPHLISTIPLFFYDLDGKRKEDMYKALNERRMLIAKENQGKLSEDMAMLVEMLSEESISETD